MTNDITSNNKSSSTAPVSVEGGELLKHFEQMRIATEAFCGGKREMRQVGTIIIDKGWEEREAAIKALIAAPTAPPCVTMEQIRAFLGPDTEGVVWQPSPEYLADFLRSWRRVIVGCGDYLTDRIDRDALIALIEKAANVEAEAVRK
jgi:hypothetical protein